MFEERLLSAKEVCEKIGICKTTARRWADSGKLKTKIITNRGDRRYYLSSVLELMGLRDSEHKDESKVEIRTIDDALRYTIDNYIFKDSPQGMMKVVDMIVDSYGFDRNEVLNKLTEMYSKHIVVGKKGKNAGLVIKRGDKK